MKHLKTPEDFFKFTIPRKEDPKERNKALKFRIRKMLSAKREAEKIVKAFDRAIARDEARLTK